MTAEASQPWTVGRLLHWTREHFQAKGIDSPRLSAELLLAHALGCKKIEVYTRFEQVPPPERVDRFRELVKQALNHAPISYLIGVKEFYSLNFVVTPDVLIPRPETETLVEQARSFCKSQAAESIDLLDIGTGSGCIAIAVAKFETRVMAVATDISPGAIAIAQQNVERHGLTERVRTAVADGPLIAAELRPPRGFDLVVSNPPYIAESALSGLPENIREFEPRVALACGDGLTLYRRMANEGGRLLRPAGRLLVEIGLGQTDAVAGIFGAAGGWRHVGTWLDLAGLDRVLGFERGP